MPLHLYLMLTFRFPKGACVPNAQFVINNRLCLCNNYGLWTEASCTIIERRQQCQVGTIVREGCNQCICQPNGQFVCSNIYCSKNQALADYNPKCIPFKSYYINCSLCTCPASGISSEAHCSKDTSCVADTNSFDFQVVKRNYCIPNVMYIFPCIECVCSENGFFALDKCIEKCQTPAKQNSRRCIPGTYYRKDCDVCLCPENSNLDETLCTKVTCGKDSSQPIFFDLRHSSVQCEPLSFMKPRCLFCDCNFEGTVKEDSCVEIDCAKAVDIQLYPERTSCSPGEVVPNCMECFCPKIAITDANYCTNVCNYQHKLRILEKVVNESIMDIIDLQTLKKSDDDEFCEPNKIYSEDGRYCLCPENGYKSYKFCTSSKVQIASKTVKENVNTTTDCKPGTYVDVDCNSCYCPKTGKIDLKWCTYDDCIAKKTIEAAHKSNIVPLKPVNSDGACVPGSISKAKCNFCICPDSGFLKERACTKNNCYDAEEDLTIGMDRFTCEPLAYYEVDCNICFCPRDGIKNVAKCTKTHCEKMFLRSNECGPGQLFTDGCNVCVCPPNGDKSDKACTEHQCDIAPLSLANLSQNLLQSKDKVETARTLDHCFPGEEFTKGCKICVCPETGLKMYASCETITCDESKNHTMADVNDLPVTDTEISDVNSVPHKRVRRFELDLCMEYTVHVESERHSCTPGSMYIVRCQQCICPYMGNINKFCRPLPKSTYCEQAYPGFNYLPMGRRCDNCTREEEEKALQQVNETIVLKVTHQHTKYRCETLGKILDECFICTCEEGKLGLTSRQYCTPNSIIVIGCNVCRCDEKGKVNREFCTHRTCTNHISHKTRRSYNVDGSCEPGNWYSTEPCQICYCVVRSKLVCNSVNKRDKLPLGKFDFTICGNNFIQEATELVSESQNLRQIKNKKKRKSIKKRLKKTTTTVSPESFNTDEVYTELAESKRNDRSNLGRRTVDSNYKMREADPTLPLYDENNGLFTALKDLDVLDHTQLEVTKQDIEDVDRGTENTGINFPSLLDNVLSIKRRKLRLSPSEKENCRPGSTFNSACERCFCLKNMKMLCLQKKC
ncbi:unnamed protein product [Leptosia nina]|uniref:Uncharacterized protein n=1 Tax=Leptosia nina TaxID=320188 RepID=A0AAV1J4E8_9NEOP